MTSFLIWGGLSFNFTSAVLWGVQTYEFFIITGGWLRLLSIWILELLKTCASLLVAIPTCYMPDHNHYLLLLLFSSCVCVQWKYWLHITIHPQYSGDQEWKPFRPLRSWIQIFNFLSLFSPQIVSLLPDF